MGLPDLWFILIAVLWTGYLVLEGFDDPVVPNPIELVGLVPAS